eukprot:CAMPEP_0178904842 /NCGR_PEP_ID=MMETSP0786-20121207/5920_1 /TAXON_ID=186022 /ORGANISM="Thalassionema frauenfeldii, Strain CCMP 1798" /LENGTH=331 /DNA_ID=CAMNT_0020576335 /DNA_START=198 /DNA_END=1193 /DNA_ORIENTATION=-
MFRMIVQLLVITGVIYYQHRRQERISCEVHGTCSRNEDFGEEQVIDANHISETEQIIRDMVSYFKRLRSDPTTSVMMHEILDGCKNQDANCAFWAIVGECDKAPGYMHTHCAPVCQSCDQLSMEMRCPMDPNAERKNCWGPGNLNDFFLNLTSSPENKKYKPKILSQPSNIKKKVSESDISINEPWVIYLDTFLSHKEADRLVSIANKVGFKPSVDGMEENSKQKNAFTSTWINDLSSQDSTVKKIISRIFHLTNIPIANAERFQIMKYEKGQAHQLHHDFIYYQAQRQPGVRILAIFLFLSDVEGGETFFPKLNISVQAKKGRGVLSFGH